MGRRGQHTPSKIPGDLTDPYGFPRLVGEFETWMGVHGYSTATVENRRRMLGSSSCGSTNAASTAPLT